MLGVIRDELPGKMVKEFVGFRAKIYCYLIHDVNKDKKQKAQKSVP